MPGQVAPVRGGVQAVPKRAASSARGRHLRGTGGQGPQAGAGGQQRHAEPVSAALRASLEQVLDLVQRGTAHCSSRWPPGAPPTPTAPITSLPTRTGTPPPSSR
jgi:hypothetical protein